MLGSDEVMQVVPQKLGAALPSVSVKDGEELDLKLGLLVAVWLDARLFKVKHDRYSVLVVVSDQAIVRVRPVGDHVWS